MTICPGGPAHVDGKTPSMALIKCGGCDAIHESTQPVCPVCGRCPCCGDRRVSKRELAAHACLPYLRRSLLFRLRPMSPLRHAAIRRYGSSPLRLPQRSREGQVGREVLRLASINRFVFRNSPMKALAMQLHHLHFSVQRMLIAVALIALAVAGYRWAMLPPVELIALAPQPTSANTDHDIFDIVLADLLNNPDFDPAVGGRRVAKSEMVLAETTQRGISDKLRSEFRFLDSGKEDIL